MNIQKYTKIIPALAFSLLGTSLTSHAQEAAPAAKEKRWNGPSIIQVYTEIIEITALEYAQIMSNPSSSSNHTELRNILIKQVEANKAKLISNQSLISRSGERSTSESIREVIYPTEYEPSEGIPNTKGNPDLPSYKPTLAILPPTPTAFETRNLGTTLEVEAILGQHHKIIDMTLKPEIVKQVGNNVFAEWVTKEAKTDVQMPTFYTLRINTSLTVLNGEFTLVGTYSPEIDGKPDDTRKLLFFVKADVLKVGK